MSSAKQLGAFRRFYRIFRWFVLVGLILVIALVLKKSPPPQVASDPEAKQRIETKFAELDRARQAGEPHTLRMEEAELNSFLGSNLGLAPAADAPPPAPAPAGADPTIEEIRSSVRDVKIDLVDDRVRAYVVFDFHGADLSLLLEGRLSVRDGYLRFDPVSGKLGSLPLPQATLDRAVARMFESEENREKLRVPPEIAGIRVENSEVVVSYR